MHAIWRRYADSAAGRVLQQFPTHAERKAAYCFVWQHLVYISPGEMNHLVELFYPETVQWRLMREAAARSRIPPYMLWADAEATALYDRLLRQTLFIELSDGARIDVFRRANAGIVSSPSSSAAAYHSKPTTETSGSCLTQSSSSSASW